MAAVVQDVYIPIYFTTRVANVKSSEASMVSTCHSKRNYVVISYALEPIAIFKDIFVPLPRLGFESTVD